MHPCAFAAALHRVGQRGVLARALLALPAPERRALHLRQQHPGKLWPHQASGASTRRRLCGGAGGVANTGSSGRSAEQGPRRPDPLLHTSSAAPDHLAFTKQKESQYPREVCELLQKGQLWQIFEPRPRRATANCLWQYWPYSRSVLWLLALCTSSHTTWGESPLFHPPRFSPIYQLFLKGQCWPRSSKRDPLSKVNFFFSLYNGTEGSDRVP